MNLENQVVSLELSKRLKELGFEQKDNFMWWVKHPVTSNFVLWNRRDLENDYQGKVFGRSEVERFSAYTTAELGEMFPEILPVKGRATDYETDYYLEISKLNGRYWDISYRGSVNCGCYRDKYWECKSEAECRAKMLIYLKENNLI